MAQVLIIGGTRFLGPALIGNLLELGDQVTLFNRGKDYGVSSPSEVKSIKGDRASESDLAQLRNLKFDYVYDMCCYSERKANLLLKYITPGTHVIFFSSAAVYEKPRILPLRENSRLGHWNAFGDYGLKKVEAERAFTEFSKQTGSYLTIFRPTYLLGINNYFDRENYFFSRLVTGAPILLPGDGKCLIQFAFLQETAEAFAKVPRSQRTQIEILNIGGNDLISINDLVILCSEIVGEQPHTLSLSPSRFSIGEEQFRDDLYPFPNMHFFVSNDRISQLYDQRFISLAEGLTEIYSWWLGSWDRTLKQTPEEREIIQALNS